MPALRRTKSVKGLSGAMFTFLLIIQTLVALALITVILMQRSEGGGLTGGGSPAGLMTARGAADFLTRATTILATAFIVLSIILAALAAHQGKGLDPNMVRQQQGQGAPLTTPGIGREAPVPSNAATNPLPNAAPAGAPALTMPLPGGNNAQGNSSTLPAAR